MLSFPIKPMLLQSGSDPFNSQDHIFEWKVDGIRCIMFFDHGKVRLQSKTGKDCTKQYPEFWAPKVMAEEAILDGEITVFTNGKPNFEGVMERYHAGEKKMSFLLLEVLVGTGAKVQGHAIGMGTADRSALWELLDEYGTEKGRNKTC